MLLKPLLLSFLLIAATIAAILPLGLPVMVSPTLTLTPNFGVAGQFVKMNGTNFGTWTSGPRYQGCWDSGNSQLAQNFQVYYIYQGNLTLHHFETAPGNCTIDGNSGVLTANFTVKASTFLNPVPNGIYIISGPVSVAFTVGTSVATATTTTWVTRTNSTTTTETFSTSTTVTVPSQTIVPTTVYVTTTVSSTTNILVTRTYNVTITQRQLVQTTSTVPFNVTTTHIVTANSTTTTTSTVPLSLSDPVTIYSIVTLIGLVAIVVIIAVAGKIRGGAL